MLPGLSLDDTNFERLLREYRSMIPGIYADWTNFNASDPGITLLELLVWLKENQVYYLDRVTSADREALLRLMGVEKRGARCARTAVIPACATPGESKRLKKGTAFYAGTLCFEAEEARQIDDRRIAALIGTDGQRTPVETGKIFGAMRCRPFGTRPQQGDTCYLKLTAPLAGGETYRIAVQIGRTAAVRRNEIREEGYASVVALEASDCDNGVSLHDQTYGFTQSGELLVTPAVDTPLSEVLGEPGYYLALRLAAGGYEIAPEIRGLSMNLLPLVQQETLCEARSARVVLSDAGAGVLTVPEKRFETGILELYLQKPNGRYRKIPSVTREQTGTEDTVLRFSAGPDQGPGPCQVYAVAVSPSFWNERHLGEAKGYDHQRFPLPYEAVLTENMELMTYDPREEEYRRWHRVSSFAEAGGEDPVFRYDAEQNCLHFGDGFHGKMPEGELFFTKLCFTLGEEGNINADLIQTCEEEDITVLYQGAASGGRQAETGKALFSRFAEKKPPQERAVTKEDYAALVRKTPGLMIETVGVFDQADHAAGRGEWQHNRIGIVVKPYTAGAEDWQKKTPFFDRAYRPNILRFLEDKRMINTELSVREAKPVPVGVYLEAEGAASPEEARLTLHRGIEAYLLARGQEFGGRLKKADLFAAIQKLQCVRRILWLNVEAYGGDAEKLPSGDLQLPVDGSLVVGEIQCSVRN